MARQPIDNSELTDDCADHAWEEWARLEPYYSVLTNPKFKKATLNAEAKDQFFESGRTHVAGVIHHIRRHVLPDFTPDTVLDFGCGVGRLVIPFARLAREVVGLDVSQTMLDEAQRNCNLQGITNAKFELSDDALTAVATQRFNLVHSAIVFQHIPTERGKLIFRRLLDCVAPGGVAAFQLLYSKSIYSETHGLAPKLPPTRKRRWYERAKRPSADSQATSAPEMQMNPYNVNELLFFMQTRGVTQFYSRFTDHSGELGLWMIFQIA